MGFLKRLFGKKKKESKDCYIAQNNVFDDDEINYYVYLDDEVFGPFSLQELKNNYPIMKDTLITADVLNGEWYEAKYFECFDELFDLDQSFYINEFGEIIKTK
jgi:hypothetical protein